MLVLGVPHNSDSFVSDEEVGKKTAATTRTTEFSETWPRYDTVHTLQTQRRLSVSKPILWEMFLAGYLLYATIFSFKFNAPFDSNMCFAYFSFTWMSKFHCANSCTTQISAIIKIWHHNCQIILSSQELWAGNQTFKTITCVIVRIVLSA